ncbi:carbohydrate ABC transporter permease [Cohnella fermenti]|uniref:Sugar ABC transporter permease n=1 Tax=Cohnella fermenti TaxID=2565925 RepID=A0A4S4BKU0_9BACL|nr:sugar ABC transporter permease [Cohnella fermenti]THF75353.1 sugar ABC transporter permease [Cohnella fermenti]
MRKTQPYAFIMPSLLLTLALGVYPILWALRYMFYDYPGYGSATYVGLDNFARLMRDAEYWNSVKNTFIYAGGKLVLTLPLSLILAVILNKAFRGRQLLRAIYFLPTIISASVMSIVFFIIFNAYNGMANQFLMKYHLISSPINWLGADYAMLTTILIAVWGGVGNYMLLFLAGLQGIPNDLYEAASLDGANAAQKLFKITIPMLGPVLQMIVMYAITVALKGYESIMVFTGGGPYGKTDVMYLYVFKQFFPISADTASMQRFGYGSAVGFASAIIVGVVTALYFYFSRKMDKIY